MPTIKENIDDIIKKIIVFNLSLKFTNHYLDLNRIKLFFKKKK